MVIQISDYIKYLIFKNVIFRKHIIMGSIHISQSTCMGMFFILKFVFLMILRGLF